MQRPIHSLLVLTLGVLLTFPAGATDDAGERLRVGLVLGGGGARGAAHIGVLQELERLKVPVDAIAGTSMGAIVGGLYASGYSANDLVEIVSTMDWSGTLADSPNRADMSFRRKQDDEQFPIPFEIGVKNGTLNLPQGVIQGHKLGLLLRELTLHVSDVRDFDELPIPFRAVASDIVSGEAFVMGEGDLADAIRASMSVPAAFAPVTIGDRLLVDGGLVGNLPVDVIRTMDVDVVIAVDVEFPLYEKEDLGSVLAISEQMLTILIRKETLRQIADLDDDDVLIRPELGMFASTDFGRIVETLAPGAEAAREQAGKLERFSVDDREWQRYLAGRERVAEPKSIDFVRVEHDSRVSPAVLESRVDIEPGDAVDANRLANEANRMYGLRLFEHVGYRLVEEDGQTGVVFDARQKSWGDGFLRFGLDIEDDFEGSTAFNLNTRLWWPAINRLGAEWRSDLTLGTDPAFYSEFYQPLAVNSPLFVSPTLGIGQRNLNVFSVDDAFARLRLSEIRVGLDAGTEIGNWGEFRIGLFRGAGDARVKVGDPSIPNLDFESGGALARLRTDTFDNPWFPRSGYRGGVLWTLSRRSLGADDDYDTVEFEFATAFSRGKNTLVLGLDYGSAIDSNSAVQDYFPLGGFLSLSGLERNQLTGPHAGLARLVAYRRIGSSAGSLLDVPVYVGASIEQGNVWQTRDDISFDSTLTNGSLFLGLDSYIGPVVLAAGFAEGGRTNFYLFVGGSFIGNGLR
ncbi:MAG: patatin-like phospholipase family protein [Woeseiaceae bacterium]|nr:patatin-like phospholipase family protein [Woeseiaceae bacterium]